MFHTADSECIRKNAFISGQPNVQQWSPISFRVLIAISKTRSFAAWLLKYLVNDDVVHQSLLIPWSMPAQTWISGTSRHVLSHFTLRCTISCWEKQKGIYEKKNEGCFCVNLSYYYERSWRSWMKILLALGFASFEWFVQFGWYPSFIHTIISLQSILVSIRFLSWLPF